MRSPAGVTFSTRRATSRHTEHVDARASTPEQLAGLLTSEIKRWSDVIAQAKIPRQ